ncbi:hypothetical protein E4U22_003182 [Claviceps purpurea]|uniref:Ribosome production factor 2 homolog n=1 Tax=Claviceps purpurea (strain 20.1) TaxID=1111077 RepID=M1VZT7_CLAP2|nr:hypothetical protein E4U12_002547 [Claviceps purpurea]CCE35268.1 probable RNA binding protein Rpf2 involved in ribosome biogenesis [Claviceps purpurea 20.1]KAG6137479.1 hypothetical protein E4U38_000920 [Claviceps purpurea]KAG6141597.1 hypothetical protein E4U28_002991 [Claviceps purpurea]KAG6156787.1 hypothetical protein E4U11_005515 [Claviceps purpurea]
MLRQVKPRNARSKRALEKREAKAIENPKTCLFLRGTSCSQVVQDALNDLHSLRLPLAKKFTKKNAIRPFEDASSLEFFSEKNDASLLVFGSTQKKRPHAVTFIRTFGYKVYDMLELYLDAETFRTMAQFKNKKFAVGLRPMLLFAGTAFESPVSNEFTLAKSMLLDFFRGEPSDKIDVEGLQYVISVTAEDVSGDGDAKPAIHVRAYMINTKRSGHKLPRVEVEEIGPRMDFRVGRSKEADESMRKDAMKKVHGLEERPKKNIVTDTMGDKIGRVHLGRQDLSELQLRKMKALKRSRKTDEDLVEDVTVEDVKRVKRST